MARTRKGKVKSKQKDDSLILYQQGIPVGEIYNLVKEKIYERKN